MNSKLYAELDANTKDWVQDATSLMTGKLSFLVINWKPENTERIKDTSKQFSYFFQINPDSNKAYFHPLVSN